MTPPGAREEILARIANAWPGPRPDVVVPREYHGPGAVEVADPLGLLAERLTDYRATVRRCALTGIASTLAAALADHPARAVVIAPGFPSGWAPPHVRVDDPPLPVAELDQVGAVVTTCTVAIAATGTLVLDHGPGQGRRALTLVPDHHVVVVTAEQVVPGVPDALARLDPTRPLTWISGPSATSDIERLSRVEGVHGPRRLEVIIVGEA